MNEKKICFIMCVNNPVFFEENLLYINRLVIPEGYEIDFLSVEDASSMTSGYNEAMHATDAKYKIYLHQDTFITDIFFLQEMIDIFQKDPQIGMIGITGTKRIPEDGVMWHGDTVSSMYLDERQKIEMCDTYENIRNEDIISVEAIDGFFMATQYDLEWRDDLFRQFDFYDASQSMEFLKAGYKIVVPVIEKPICVHDDGYILNLENYEESRKIFLREYGEFLASRK